MSDIAKVHPMIWTSSNPFLKELKRRVVSLQENLPVSEKDLEIDSDCPFDKQSPQSLGRLAGAIILQAATDGASCIRLSFGDGKMYYTVDGTEYDMTPPPAFAMIDLIREFFNASGASIEEPGSFDVQLFKKKRSLKVECVGNAMSVVIWFPSQ